MFRNFPITFLTVLIMVNPACQTGRDTEPVRPNILFIMSDDHGYQAISRYGAGLNQTPNIDRLAEEGVLFRNSFVTNSICAPSRATMLTGKFSHLNGQYTNGDTFDSSQVTFPKLLQKNGYQTALVGKWHLKSQPTGFDYWNILPGQGQYYNPDFIKLGERYQAEGYVTDLITDEALEWLDQRDPGKPFCLLLHHKAPHRTWMPDTTHFYLYQEEQFDVPENFFDDYDGRRAAAGQKMSIIEDMDLAYDLKMVDPEGAIQTPYRKWFEGQLGRMNEDQRRRWDEEYLPRIRAFKQAGLEGKELAVWKLRRYLTDYLRCIASVDENVGRVLDYLDANGLAEHTLVVYTSDQGFYLGEHGWFDKRFMYEESFRTPLIMRFPGGIKANGTKYELVQNIDYAPTFLDYAGVPIPEGIQGVSLRPVLEDQTPEDWRTSVYYHYYEFPNEHMVKKHYGIRTDRYKLIHFYDDIDDWEFYDLRTDPDEMNNLYGRERVQSLIDSLYKILEERRSYYHDEPFSQDQY
jgi:arylsulfatase A-like enzyme